MHIGNDRRTQNPAFLSGGWFHGKRDASAVKQGAYSRGGRNSKRKTLRSHRIGK